MCQPKCKQNVTNITTTAKLKDVTKHCLTPAVRKSRKASVLQRQKKKPPPSIVNIDRDYFDDQDYFADDDDNAAAYKKDFDD